MPLPTFVPFTETDHLSLKVMIHAGPIATARMTFTCMMLHHIARDLMDIRGDYRRDAWFVVVSIAPFAFACHVFPRSITPPHTFEHGFAVRSGVAA
jgi:hypothetical protein